MKELLEFIAKSMVSEPDAVSIEENVQENSVVLTLQRVISTKKHSLKSA